MAIYKYLPGSFARLQHGTPSVGHALGPLDCTRQSAVITAGHLKYLGLYCGLLSELAGTAAVSVFENNFWDTIANLFLPRLQMPQTILWSHDTVMYFEKACIPPSRVPIIL